MKLSTTTAFSVFLCSVLLWACAAVHAQPRGHALLIGISQYTPASGSTPLLGVPKDLATARRMAVAMGIPDGNITELRDQAATKPSIVAALNRLKKEVGVGERVFIYFSGHGTSYSSGKGCEEGLVPYTEGRHTVDDLISESELATHTSGISEKADKAIVMIDACFSGGLGASATRSLSAALNIKPKFTARAGERCGAAVNQRTTRSFVPAMQRLGTPEQNFVQISAANYNEVSWDNDEHGGLATYNLGQCVLGEAKDLNRSGAISLEEIRQCAQVKLNAMMAPFSSAGMLPSTIQVRGTRNLIVVPDPPKPVVQVPPAVAVVTPAPPTAPATPFVPVAPVEPAPAPETQAEQALASAATLEDIYAQRNGRLKLEVTAPKTLTIDKDALKFSVKSNADGYLYAVMLGSDGKSFYLLFPNKMDADNRIKANVRYTYPRNGWSVKAAGPQGTNRVLFVVSPSPRDPKIFVPDEPSGGGSFTYALSEMTGRQRLIDFFVGRGVKGSNSQLAAALVDIEEAP